MLIGFGLLTVHSASITSWPTEYEQIYLIRHAKFLALGIIAAIFCGCLPSQFWFKMAPLIYSGTIALLVAVLIPGIGTEVNGARRWIRQGPISMQPSELAKIALPLFLCMLMTKRRQHMGKWIGGTLPLLIPIGIMAGLVVKEPDLGTALFLGIGAAVALFLGGWPIRNFVVSGGLAVPALGYLVALKPYQVKRITDLAAAWIDFDQAHPQVKNSLRAFGAGGPLGTGLGKGWQKFGYLPEANTDFVFAVVGEELGLIGTLTVIALWFGWFIVGLRLFQNHRRTSFEYIAGVTLLTQVSLQAALNMAVVTAMAPTTGIPHPLISYGGSSLVVSIVTLGIIVSLANTESHVSPAAD